MLLNSILQHAARQPEKLAVVSDGRGISYELFARLILSARRWAEKSPGSGDGVVVICGGDLLTQWVTIIALRSLGRAVAVVPDLTMTAQLRLGRIDAIILAPDRDGRITGEDTSVSLAATFTLPKDAVTPLGGRLPRSIDERMGDYIEYTSGTTGNYKAVRKTGAGFAALCDRVVPEYRIGPDTLLHLGSLAPWSSVGSKCPVTLWREGAACIFDTRPDWLEHILDWPIDRLFVTPPLVQKLAGIRSGRRSEKLQVFSGGGFLPFAAARRLRDLLGCDVFVNYGGTEFGLALQSRVMEEDDVIWLPVFDGVDIAIVDEDGNECGTDKEGELRIRLHVSDGDSYVGDAEASREFFRAGYFHSGDLAVRRADGRIRILGRATQVLNIGGNKQAIGPVERRACELLGVDSLCLFTQQSNKGEEFLLVMIEGQRKCDSEQIEAFSAEFARWFPNMAVIYFDSFPRKGPMQKVDRGALLEFFRKSSGGRNLSFGQ